MKEFKIQKQGQTGEEYYVMLEVLSDGSTKYAGFSSPSRYQVKKEIEATLKDMAFLEQSKIDTEEFRNELRRYERISKSL